VLQYRKDGSSMAALDRSRGWVRPAEQVFRMGDYIAQILGGAKPGELAIHQGSKFELLLNIKAAKLLGLTLPPF